jgi:polycystin 1L2
LGLLNFIHIWHDNSGEDSSASWFLKYIIILDLQTMDKFYFIAQQWFAVEKDDGKVSLYCYVNFISSIKKKDRTCFSSC